MAAFANEAAYQTAMTSLKDTLVAALPGNTTARVALSKFGELVAAVRNANGYDASESVAASY